MKKILSLILISSLVIISLFSCKEKNREYDREIVLAAARELIEDSKELNEIYWGKGISYLCFL